MNEKEIKAQLLAAGATEEQLASVNYKEIEDIVTNATGIDDLCVRMKKIKPDFAEEEFKAQLAALSAKESDASEDSEVLSEEQLENVAGGSVGGWLKKNAYWLVPTLFTAAVVGYTAAQGYVNYKADKSVMAKNNPKDSVFIVRGQIVSGQLL